MACFVLLVLHIVERSWRGHGVISSRNSIVRTIAPFSYQLECERTDGNTSTLMGVADEAEN
jgi:hypothetical protein